MIALSSLGLVLAGSGAFAGQVQTGSVDGHGQGVTPAPAPAVPNSGGTGFAAPSSGAGQSFGQNGLPTVTSPADAASITDQLAPMTPPPVPGINPNSPGDAATFAWQDTNKYVECGQSCLHDKANENLSLQALKTLTTYERLTTAYTGDKSTGSPPDYATVNRELSSQGYCKVNDVDDADQAKNCLLTYMAVQMPILRSVRSAISYNEDASAQIHSKPGTKLVGAQDRTGKLIQTPYVTTSSDLALIRSKQLKDAAQGRGNLANNAYGDWLKTAMQRFKPSCDDFPKSHNIPRDPSNPGGAQLQIIDRDANGNVACNTQLRDIAIQKWSQISAGVIANSNTSGMTVEAAQNALLKLQSNQNDQQNLMKDNRKNPLRTLAMDNANQLGDFKQARFELKTTTDSLIGPNGKIAPGQTQNFGGAHGAAATQKSQDLKDAAYQASRTAPELPSLPPPRFKEGNADLMTVSFSQDQLDSSIQGMHDVFYQIQGLKVKPTPTPTAKPTNGAAGQDPYSHARAPASDTKQY